MAEPFHTLTSVELPRKLGKGAADYGGSTSCPVAPLLHRLADPNGGVSGALAFLVNEAAQRGPGWTQQALSGLLRWLAAPCVALGRNGAQTSGMRDAVARAVTAHGSVGEADGGAIQRQAIPEAADAAGMCVNGSRGSIGCRDDGGDLHGCGLSLRPRLLALPALLQQPLQQLLAALPRNAVLYGSLDERARRLLKRLTAALQGASAYAAGAATTVRAAGGGSSLGVAHAWVDAAMRATRHAHLVVKPPGSRPPEAQDDWLRQAVCPVDDRSAVAEGLALSERVAELMAVDSSAYTAGSPRRQQLGALDDPTEDRTAAGVSVAVSQSDWWWVPDEESGTDPRQDVGCCSSQQAFPSYRPGAIGNRMETNGPDAEPVSPASRSGQPLRSDDSAGDGGAGDAAQETPGQYGAAETAAVAAGEYEAAAGRQHQGQGRASPSANRRRRADETWTEAGAPTGRDARAQGECEDPALLHASKRPRIAPSADAEQPESVPAGAADPQSCNKEVPPSAAQPWSELLSSLQCVANDGADCSPDDWRRLESLLEQCAATQSASAILMPYGGGDGDAAPPLPPDAVLHVVRQLLTARLSGAGARVLLAAAALPAVAAVERVMPKPLQQALATAAAAHPRPLAEAVLVPTARGRALTAGQAQVLIKTAGSKVLPLPLQALVLRAAASAAPDWSEAHVSVAQGLLEAAGDGLDAESLAAVCDALCGAVRGGPPTLTRSVPLCRLLLSLLTRHGHKLGAATLAALGEAAAATSNFMTKPCLAKLSELLAA